MTRVRLGEILPAILGSDPNVPDSNVLTFFP